MSIKIPAIATWLAGLTVTGLSIKDLDAIKENVLISDCPVLLPHPVNYVTGLQVTHNSFGRGQDTLTYMLNYRLYFRPVTGVIKFFGPYDEMIDAVCALLDKIQMTATPSSVADILPGINAIGGVEDAAGNVYHGCDFTLSVTEYYEAV